MFQELFFLGEFGYGYLSDACDDARGTRTRVAPVPKREPMLHNHAFPEPRRKRSSRLVRTMWLPIVVISAGSLLIGAALMGVNLRVVWAGSTLLSAFVMAYTFLFLFRVYRRQKERSTPDRTLIKRPGPRKR